MCLFIYGYFKVLGKFIVSFFEYLYNNSLKRYFTNIRGLCSNFVGCKSFLEWKCLHFLALCEWMNQLILAISLWGVSFLLSERILLHICMVLQFIRRREFLLNETYLYKTLKILIIFCTGFASFIFTFFPLSTTFLLSLHDFWCYFTWNRWGSLNKPIS